MKKTILALFTLSLLYLTYMVAPNITWLNTASDGSTYLTAAKYHELSHPVGAPLYNLVNWAWIEIPIYNEFWVLSMVSAIYSSVTVVFLYLISLKWTDKRWSVRNFIAPGIYISSGLVVSQSTIVETYTMATMFSTMMFYLHIIGKRRLKYIVAGLGIVVHPIIILVAIPILVSDWWNSGKDLRLTFRSMLMMTAGLPFYAYLALCNSEPYLWIKGDGVQDYFMYFLGQSHMIGGLSIIPHQELIERLEDMSIILVGTLSINLVIIGYLIYRAIRNKEYLLPVLFILPIVYWFANISPQVYVYAILAYVFGGIILAKHWNILHKTTKVLSCVAVITFLIVNPFLYDIGNTVDKDMAAVQFYEDLDTLPPDATVLSSHRGWEQTMIRYYNIENDTNMTCPMFISEDSRGNYKNENGADRAYRFMQHMEESVEANKLYVTLVTDNKSMAVRLERLLDFERAILYLLSDPYYYQEVFSGEPDYGEDFPLDVTEDPRKFMSYTEEDWEKEWERTKDG